MFTIEIDRIQQLTQVIQRIHKHNQQLKSFKGIAHSEYMILQMLYCSQKKSLDITITDLSEAIQITKPAVSQIINSLETKALVERHPSQKDRRIVHVKLTAAGEAAVQEIRTHLSEKLLLILEKMGSEDSEAFLLLLDKFSQIMSEV